MNSTQHLSDDDLDELLIDAASSSVAAHLAACPSCSRRHADLQAAFHEQIGAFNHASLAWSQARSNSISRNLAAHRLTPRLTLSAIRSSAAALVFTLALGVTVGMHRGASSPGTATPNAASAVQPESSTEPDIEGDNAMLAAIDSAIVTPQPARFGLYESTNDTVQPRRRAASPRVKD